MSYRDRTNKYSEALYLLTNNSFMNVSVQSLRIKIVIQYDFHIVDPNNKFIKLSYSYLVFIFLSYTNKNTGESFVYALCLVYRQYTKTSVEYS